jgi:lipopolysaccharide heptosyltransferase II
VSGPPTPADPSRAPRPIDPDAIRSLLVRSTNWIGDVVMISPALRALRAGFPAARLDVLARATVAEAYRGHPFVDVIVEERRSGSRRHDGLPGLLRLAADLRRRRYDLAVILPKSIGAALAPALARIPRRVGYPTAGRRALLTHPVPLPQDADAIHHVEFFLGTARWLGCPVVDRSLVFSVPESDRQAASELLAGAGWDADGALWVAIHPGASRPERSWAAERFGEVARALAARGNRILVLGAPADRDAARVVLEAAGPAAVDAVGFGGIARMAALVERCALFLGNDSGPMHVAAAIGTPTVAVFGPGVPGKTAPYVPEDRRREVTRNYPCAPCRQDFFRECSPAPSGKPWCLESVGPDEVLAAAVDLLDRR